MIYREPNIEPVRFQGMITVSDVMKDFFALIKKVAHTESAILIRGQSGTGKELVARAIHNLSSRKASAFNAINCATLTSELMTSELFGHVKGAFTGAVSDHKGLFEASHKGTLFLDEIAELPLDIQSRLLRVLQERSFFRVGSTKQVYSDVRILSATHRALRHEVRSGRFREDLMYRIRVVPVFLPPLSQRPGDIEVLCWRFIREFNAMGLRQISGIDAVAYDALMSYPWPGNIGELRNNIEYAFAVGEGDLLTINELPPELRGEMPDDDILPFEENSFKNREHEAMAQAMQMHNGRKAEAAASLGMSRSTFWRKAKQYGLF